MCFLAKQKSCNITKASDDRGDEIVRLLGVVSYVSVRAAHKIVRGINTSSTSHHSHHLALSHSLSSGIKVPGKPENVGCPPPSRMHNGCKHGVAVFLAVRRFRDGCSKRACLLPARRVKTSSCDGHVLPRERNSIHHAPWR